MNAVPRRVVDAVLLDVDDTLLTTESAMVSAGSVALRTLWPDLADRDATHGSRLFRDDPWGHFRAFTRGEVTFEQMRQGRLEGVADALGRTLPPRAQPIYEDAFRPAFEASLQLYDDVPAFLDRCRAVGLPVGLLTNSSGDYTERKLAAVGLTGRVGPVVTRDTLGFGKPDPRAFHHACMLLGTDPARTAYAGDELDVDAIGAHAAGLQAWLVLRGSRAPEGEVPAQIRVVEGLAQVDVFADPAQVRDMGREPMGDAAARH